MTGRRCPAVGALLLVTALVLAHGLAGCAGPKRLPAVEASPRPGPGVEVETPPPAAVATEPAKPVAPPIPWLEPAEPLRLLGVGLLEDKPSLELRCEGAAWVRDAESGRTLAAVEAGEPLICRRAGDNVAWRTDKESGHVRSVALQPIDPGFLVSAPGGSYRGEFLVLATPRGHGVTLVNNVELEDYLKGVVPWEIGRHGPEKFDALCAQAVAARTYTMSHLGSRAERGFDLFATVMDQVYRGATDEDARCNEAIAATAPLVLRQGDREIDAYYSACCGGSSAAVSEVWPKDDRPYLRQRADGPGHDGEAWCSGSPYFHWRETWSAGALERILQRTLPAYVEYMAQQGRGGRGAAAFTPARGGSAGKPGKLRDLEIRQRTPSGRVGELAVVTDAGTYHVCGDRVRWVLAPAAGNSTILRSALFELELVRDGDKLREVAARGRGFGHGIGLCQTGALGMAAAGRTWRDILAHYYPGATLEPVPRQAR
jgi:stage II sporulation protein D